VIAGHRPLNCVDEDVAAVAVDETATASDDKRRRIALRPFTGDRAVGRAVASEISLSSVRASDEQRLTRKSRARNLAMHVPSARSIV